MWSRVRLCPRHFRYVLQSYVRKLCSASERAHVCIVGSGPAGFYTAQQLLKGNANVKVDIYEKLPTPFGLVRYGVAPDHPEVKNVIHTFQQTASNKRCSFIGNVAVGTDVTLAELQKSYSAVVMCYGADDDRHLEIPGEDLPNVLSARSFVGWYNGLPKDQGLTVDLDTEVAVVLGHGNVALDVARILLTPIDILAKTDLSSHALEALSKSRINRVHVVGRRGPLQVAFTIKELREMVKLPDSRPALKKSDYEGLEKILKELPRPRKRLTDLMYKTCIDPPEAEVDLWKTAEKEWSLHFLLSPTQFIPDPIRNRVGAVKFAVNRLEGASYDTQKAVMTDSVEEIPCGLVLRSIGYKSIPIEGDIPFNTQKGIIPNEKGRVMGAPGLYCSGWVGRGPVGVILDTMSDGFNTGKVIGHDLESGRLQSSGKHGKGDILKLLAERGVQVVTYTDWCRIDEAEVRLGEPLGKPREKLTDVKEMLKIASSQ